MKIQTIVRTSSWLFIAMITTYFVFEISNLSLFAWISMVASVWLFLNLYWLGICCVHHLSARGKIDREPANSDEVTPDVEPIYESSHDRISSYQSHQLRYVIDPEYRNKEKLKWN